MQNLSEEEQRYILQTFFENNNNISNTQINSFNYFITHGLSSIITGEEITIELKDGKHYRLQFGNVYVDEPYLIDNQTPKPLYPSDARRRDLNYEGNVVCDLIETMYNSEDNIIWEKSHTRIMIAKVPIMVYSNRCTLVKLSRKERMEKNECKYDQGGYFIVKGNEKVLMGQIRANYNRPFIAYKQDKAKEYFTVDVRSMSEQTSHSVQLSIKLNVIDRKITITLPYIDTPIPIGVIFKAYGFVSDNDIKTLIGLDLKKAEPYIYSILINSAKYITQEDAIKFIGTQGLPGQNKEKQMAYVKQILDNEILPHVSIISKPIIRAYFIARLVNKLLSSAIGIRKGFEHDRDNLANKRIETAGILCYDLFNSLFKRYMNMVKIQLEKKKDNISIINNVLTNITTITAGLRHSFATGNWGVKKNAYIRTGVSQILSRMTFPATISHLRRFVCPIGGKEAPIKIRQINGSQFGYLCPSETPEGETAGVVLNMALTCDITNTVPTIMVKEALTLIDTTEIEIKNMSDTSVVILLNEDIIGLTDEPLKYVSEFKKLRDSRFIHSLVSIAYDYMDREIRICTDRGRCTRPLLVVEKFKTKPQSYDWSYLLKNGYVQYVDCNEIEWSYVAMFPRDITSTHDFCEIHPISQLGNVASCIPFPNHSQAPRNVYQSSMGKQALGMYSMVYNKRTDTNSYVMWYPQRPLVTSMTSGFMKCNDMPSGIQCIVMIACLKGYNQEDSLIMNKNSIDRGLFVTTTYKTITEIEKKKCIYTTEMFCIPPPSNNKKNTEPGYFKRISNNYSLLDSNGIVKVNSNVKKGDIIIGKIIIKNSKTSEDILTDCSISVKSGDEGVVDQVYIDYTVDGQKIVKIVIRQLKVPEPGDKFAARSAQKGTACIIVNQEDLPFTKEGIIPDIIINPHCMLSRMTINQLLECVLGKSCALSGTFGDCTAFSSNQIVHENDEEDVVEENKTNSSDDGNNSDDSDDKYITSDEKYTSNNMYSSYEEKDPKENKLKSSSTATKVVETSNIADVICDRLAPYGYEKHGNEMATNGTTGEMFKTDMFIGPTFYQRLKHIVKNKMHARSIGHVTTSTRQPLEGRSRDGGLRHGEMERDCMISHGCANFLNDRLYTCSDPFEINVCKHCGHILSSHICTICQKNDSDKLKIPYACKSLIQQLQSMAIKITLQGEC